MAHIVWDSRLETGIRDIDEQNRWLIGFFNALESKRRQSDVGMVLGELWTFAKLHFLTEEVAMLERNYPETESHREEHRMALRRIEQMLRRVGEGETVEPSEPRQFLQAWLIDHTAKVDARFAAYLKSHPYGSRQAHGCTA